jgi:transforming growth factor-beta-induced protein
MRSKLPVRIAGAVLALSLVGAACGDDDSADAPASQSGAPATTAAAATKDIVDTAVGAGTFTVLVEAVQSAGLVNTLKGTGPFTVLAPTDQAFADALKALNLTKAQLLADKTTLTSILTYHVIPSKAMAADVVKLNGKEVATVNGAKVKVSVSGNTVKMNDATVTKTDIAATNGVIHVIDKVLLPPKA